MSVSRNDFFIGKASCSAMDMLITEADVERH